MAKTVSPYPSKVVIRQALEAGRAGGLDIAGYEVAPNGVIRVFDKRATPTQPDDLVDELKRLGQI